MGRYAARARRRVALLVAAVLAVWLSLKGSPMVQLARTAAVRLLGRVVIVATAGAGALALLNDIDAIV